MTPGSTLPDDDARVARLRAYGVLDTGPDPQFDAIVQLATHLLDAPIALISLADKARLWFLARRGLDLGEAPRIGSFCGLVVADRAPLIVSDTRADARFATSALVVEAPHARAYIGVPLGSGDGAVLGTLCVLDRVPRTPTPTQLDGLRLLADQVVALLELRRASHALRDERRELADREARLAIVFDTMADGVVVQDRSGAILHHNRAALAILGLTEDQLRGRTSLDPRWAALRADGTPFPGEEHPAMVALRTGEPQSDVAMRIDHPSGEHRWLSIDARALIAEGDPKPYAAIATFRDLSKHRALADRLGQQQRLITAGTLAAGVGHEINNPLTSVLTNLGLAIETVHDLLAEAPSDRLSEVVAMLEQARQGGERVRGIVRGLKAIARANDQLIATDVNTAVRSAIKAASHELRTRASVRLELARAPIAHTDSARIVQVLTHLLTNAAQAFAHADPSANQITVRTTVDRQVTIAVVDNGPGIAPEILPRVFDPFFTTKAVGAGVGLGLAIAHGALVALGGEIRCDSTLGQGSTFTITLPLAQVAPAPAPRPPRARLLVVDDEAMILTSFTRLFERDFEVVTYSDPRDALRTVQAGQEFDLVFCDLTMPYLSGMELYEEVSAASPEIARRFVFVSGDLSRDDIRAFLGRIPNERIEKPFSLQAVRGIARRYLPAEPASAPRTGTG